MMLTRLILKNFTVFDEADFQFASGINVIVGENGAGKSHALKAAYSVAAVSASGLRGSGQETPTKSYLETAVAKKLRSSPTRSLRTFAKRRSIRLSGQVCHGACRCLSGRTSQRLLNGSGIGASSLPSRVHRAIRTSMHSAAFWPTAFAALS